MVALSANNNNFMAQQELNAKVYYSIADGTQKSESHVDTAIGDLEADFQNLGSINRLSAMLATTVGKYIGVTNYIRMPEDNVSRKPQ